ncbi:MAG: HDIG domain-containing protein [Oscillospiraceae bacterium]|nr:HDIG domain-containing protein [Oscillospiraceae bacterium]
MNAEEILISRDPPEKVLRHCLAVGKLSFDLAQALNGAGCRLDAELCRRGGILHDICRTEKNHAERGRELLASMGLKAEAAIVGAHMGEGIDPGSIGEKEVVFLADKLLKCDRRVSVEARYGDVAEKYAGDAEAVAAAEERKKQALALKEKAEAVLGRSLDEI